MKKININHWLPTLRSRLLVWFLSFFFIITIGTFSFFIFFYYQSLQKQIDHHLYSTLSKAQQIIINYHSYQRNSILTELVGSEAMTVVLLSFDGSSVLQTNSPDVALVSEHQLQQVISQQTQSSSNTDNFYFSVGETRFIASKYISSDESGYIAVGYSMRLIIKTLQNYILVFIGVLLFILIMFSYLTYWFLGKNLSDLEEIANFAREIKTTKDLLQKRKVPSSDLVELNQISLAIRKMVGDLESIFKREKDFFSDTAHTIKTPLAVLRSEVEILSISKSKKELLTKNIDHIVLLVKDLLFLSKVQSDYSLLRQDTSLSEITNDLSDLASSLAQSKNIKVYTDIEQNLILKADKNSLTKALGNIIKNAIEHTLKNGIISIRLYRNTSERIIYFSVTNSDSYICKEDKKKIFNRFYKVRSSNLSDRFGIGLAITKAVVENMGGSIIVKSNKSIGTTFIIKLSY